MYKNGIGAPKNYNKANYWLMKASKKGQSGAQHQLALMYRDELGVPKDRVVAYAILNWISSENTINKIDIVTKERDKLEEKLSDNELKSAQILSSAFSDSEEFFTEIEAYLKRKSTSSITGVTTDSFNLENNKPF